MLSLAAFPYLNLLLLAATALSLLLAASACLMVLSLRRRLQLLQQENQQLIAALRKESYVMTNSALGVGQRLLEVEKRLSSTMEKQMEIEQRDPGSLPYAYAVRLVEMGATTEDLINNCGLARVEAELITLVHSEIKAYGNQKATSEERYTLN